MIAVKWTGFLGSSFYETNVMESIAIWIYYAPSGKT